MIMLNRLFTCLMHFGWKEQIMDGHDDYLLWLLTKTMSVCLNRGNILSKSNSFFN